MENCRSIIGVMDCKLSKKICFILMFTTSHRSTHWASQQLLFSRSHGRIYVSFQSNEIYLFALASNPVLSLIYCTLLRVIVLFIYFSVFCDIFGCIMNFRIVKPCGVTGALWDQTIRHTAEWLIDSAVCTQFCMSCQCRGRIQVGATGKLHSLTTGIIFRPQTYRPIQNS